MKQTNTSEPFLKQDEQNICFRIVTKRKFNYAKLANIRWMHSGVVLHKHEGKRWEIPCIFLLKIQGRIKGDCANFAAEKMLCGQVYFEEDTAHHFANHWHSQENFHK